MGMAKSACYAHAVKITFQDFVVKEPALDLDDDDASTASGDNRVRVENEWMYASAMPRKQREVIFTNLSSMKSHSDTDR